MNNREPGNDASRLARPTPRRSALQELPDNHPKVFACLRASLKDTHPAEQDPVPGDATAPRSYRDGIPIIASVGCECTSGDRLHRPNATLHVGKMEIRSVLVWGVVLQVLVAAGPVHHHWLSGRCILLVVAQGRRSVLMTRGAVLLLSQAVACLLSGLVRARH